MNPPKVSVLIPAYNGGRYLGDSLESILAQDFQDMEILLSDDGSTDASVGIMEKFAARDPRVRWWQNRSNAGLGGNTNVCIREARGEYLKFVHQDDLLISPAAIRKLAAALDENPRASLAGCRQHLTGTGRRPTIFSERGGRFDGRKMIVASLEQNTNLIGQPTLTMFRRHQAERGFDERFTGFLDFEMWCHLLEQGDYAYLPEELATWRVHEEQQTARSMANQKPDLEHLQFMETYYAKPWLREAATPRMLFAQVYYLEKKYGEEARGLTNVMRSQLKPGHFAWQWARHKLMRPLTQLGNKLGKR